MARDRSDDSPQQNVLLLLFAVGAFIACTIGAYYELRYASSSRTTDATVRDMGTVKHQYHGSVSYTTRFIYAFADNRKERIEMDEVSPDWLLSHPDVYSVDRHTLTIQYLPGEEGHSRIAGNMLTWLLYLFALSVVFILTMAARFWRDYRAYQRRLAEGD